MKIITESEMNFGKFDETNLFHIENSKIYKDLGLGIKTVEFILKYDENSIVFLEAKKSCPNVANRYESEEKEQKSAASIYLYFPICIYQSDSSGFSCRASRGYNSGHYNIYVFLQNISQAVIKKNDR